MLDTAGSARREKAQEHVTTEVRGVWAKIVEALGHRPYALVAVKSAVAAGLAWLIIQPLGGPADDYPYYAPLGAVVVMSTTAIHSVRTSVQSLIALGVGAALGVVGAHLPGPEVAALMVVVGLGTALSVWHRLGAMGVWVPFAALFVLLLGGQDPWHYVLGYFGLTALGAAVGVAINVAAPQLPLGRTLHAVTALRQELGAQLRTLADEVASERDLSVDGEKINASIRPRARQLETLVAEVRDARRANWRAGRWRQVADKREEQAKALEHIAYLVEELAALVSRSSRVVMAGHSELGATVADSLRCTAAMVEAGDEAYDQDDEGRSPYGETRRHITDLRRLVLENRDRPRDAADDVLIGASVAVGLERALDAWS